MLKKRKGAALVVAIAIMAILTILGTTLLNLSIFETNMIARQNRKMQAFYYARAGAEAVMEPFIHPKKATKPTSGTVKFVFQGGNFAVTSGTATTFDCLVTVSTSGSTTTITSTGTYLKESKTVTVTMYKIPPDYGDNYGWYNYHSGKINAGDYRNKHVHGPVVIKPNNKLKYPNKNDPDSVFGADTIYLDVDYETPDHNKLTLVCETVVIKGNTSVFNAGSSLPGASSINADIFLELAPSKGISIGTLNTTDNQYYYIDYYNNSKLVSGKYGKLYIMNSATGDYDRYYYPNEDDGISLRFEVSKLIRMNPTDPNWTVPDYDSIYRIIWS